MNPKSEMPPNPPTRSWWVVVSLALLLGLQPITTDLYLPALPAVARDLSVDMAQLQLTLTALLLAFGVSQLLWGPLSDRIGRKPVLTMGLSVYVLASVGTALASAATELIVWRVLQGVGMGAGIVCARALVRDLYAPAEGARVMAAGLTGLGVVACAAGPLGGAIAAHLHWHAALWAVVGFGAAALAVVVLRLPETLVLKNPHATQPGVMFSRWGRAARHPTFWAWCTLATASYGGLFTFLAASAFVYTQNLGLSAAEYGAVLLLSSACYIAGTLVCRHLLQRIGQVRAVQWAALGTLAGGLAPWVLAHAGYVTVATVLAPWPLFMLAHGIHQPCSQTGVVGPFPHMAGAAAALSGFVMMLVAFAIGAWLGQSMDGSAWPMLNGIALWSVAIASAAWGLVRHFGTPP